MNARSFPSMRYLTQNKHFSKVFVHRAPRIMSSRRREQPFSIARQFRAVVAQICSQCGVHRNDSILAAFSVPNEQSAFFEIAISYSKSQCLIYTQPAAIQNTVSGTVDAGKQAAWL